jgi:hypothetical protein
MFLLDTDMLIYMNRGLRPSQRHGHRQRAQA